MSLRLEWTVSLLFAIGLGVAYGLVFGGARRPPPLAPAAVAIAPAGDPAEPAEQAALADTTAPTSTAGVGRPPAPSEPAGPSSGAAAQGGERALAGRGATAAPHARGGERAGATPEPSPTDAGDLVPALAEAVDEDDVSLIRRGAGHVALLDFKDAGIRTLMVREGRLDRDGDGNFRPFRRNKVVARLVAPKGEDSVRVELLHLGFDREGRPSVAHIRTTGAAPVEGVVSLRLGGKSIIVRRDRPLEPPREAPTDAPATTPDSPPRTP
jgi:hypothetical protein